MLSDTVRQRAKFLLMRRVKQAEEEVISSWCDVQDKTTLTQLSDLSSCSMLGHGQFTVIVRKGQLLQFIKLSKCPTPDAHEEEADNFPASHFLSSECNYKMTVNRNREGQDEVWKITLDRSAHRIRRKARPPFDRKRPPVEHWSATAAQIGPAWKVIS